MKRLHVLLEGQTEEVLFNRVFAPHWTARGWLTTSSVVSTSRAGSGAKVRGGVSSWVKLKREIRLLLNSQFDAVTTIIDYYGFPADAPGMADRPNGTAVARVEHVEDALHKTVGDPRFIPHLTLHEVEAWVFAAADQLAGLAGIPHLAARLRNDASHAGGPELVNDGPSSAPSKRIREYWPSFTKTADGPQAVMDLGLGSLREQCPHLDAWLQRLEAG